MKKRNLKVIIVAVCTLIVLFLTISSLLYHKKNNEPTINGRWYTQKQVILGKQIYTEHCLECHNTNAQGTTGNKPLADGSYPPPPLNGTAHTWHHPLPILQQIIQNGGIAYGGKMPAFKNKLTNSEQQSVISYFQTFWDDKIYGIWEKTNQSTQ